MIQDKNILVTGGAGSIGSELVRQLAKDNRVFILDFNETGLFNILAQEQKKGHWVHGRVGNIRDEETLKDVFSDFRPDIVFHAAAYKHVPLMETYWEEAVETNVNATGKLIKYSKKYEVKKFIFISTDKAVQSSSVMGAAKRLSEIITRNQGAGYTVVRFGNVLGSRGSVIPIWEEQIEKKEKNLSVTHPDMERFMMTIEEACELVIEAAVVGEGGEIMILDMGQPIKILDLAKKIISDSKLDMGIEITGMRKGEELSEKLMFEEEQRIAVKSGKFFIIKK